MAVCPNTNLPEWKKLVAAKGEREAYYLWAKYDGDIPASELIDAPIDDGFETTEAEGTVNTLSDKESYDVIQEMTFLMLNNLIKTDQSLFNIEKLNAKDLYQKLKIGVLATVRGKEVVINNILNKNENLTDSQKDRLLSIIKDNRQLQKNILVDWPRLVEKHKEYIKAYNVEFDENDSLQINDEDRVKESNRFDATKIDSFRKANIAIKLLLASNPIVDDSGNAVLSSINGRLLMPVSKSYITLMNKLHTSTNIEEMLERLRQLAIEDPAYSMLYTRLTRRSANSAGVDLTNIDTTHGIQLISGLWKTFKKQNPDVKNVFIFENGEVAVGDASLSTAANQLRNDYINAIATLAKADKGFFKYNESKRKYIADKTRVSKVTLTGPQQMVNFLSQLGIPFTVSEYNKLSDSNKKQFRATVGGIKKSILESSEISTFSKKSLNLNKRLLEMGVLKTAASNPEFSSTYFNLSGERVQSFIGVNAVSELYDTLSKINNLNELAGTNYEYLLKDVFVKGSNLLSRMFNLEDGKKKAGANELLKSGYVGGTNNEKKNKKTSSSRLTQKQRLIQELNLNREGQYMNLVPGDASIEHMIYMGNAIAVSDLVRGFTDINEIFKGYFLSELELSRDDRPVASNRDNKDLRFFKGILGDELHNEIIETEGTLEEVYAIYETQINNAVRDFIMKDVQRTSTFLERFGILQESDKTITVENVDGLMNIDKNQWQREMIVMSVNYIVANIEMHKLLYSDPYQYKDELKRIKSFLSPRQALVSNSPKMNAAYNKIWNDGYDKDDIGYTNFTQDYMRTASHKDVVGVIDLPNYDSFEETDGGGIIAFKAHRNFRIRASDWNENEEKQYRYDVAWEKRDKGITLSTTEVKLLNEGNPQVQSAYTPSKPIVSGNKLDKNGEPSPFNNIVLDKYSLYPLSYRVMKEVGADNAVKLYNKMQNENIDYIVFESGRKVGAEKSHATYVESTQQSGEGVAVFNDAEYESVVNVPLSIMSLQSDVPSKEKALVTRGSQVTKLITMDYMDNGVPFDYKGGLSKWITLSKEEKEASSEIYKEISKNQILLEEMTNEGYQMLLKRLGIIERDGELVVEDRTEATKTFRDEIFKRETNDNIQDAISGFLDGDVVLETTPAYQIVRNILYSIVDKQIVSPKISGGQKVQIPPALFESNRVAETEINGKKGYTSDVLGFYNLTKDGKEVKFLEDNKNGTYKVLTEEGKEINIPVNDLKTTTMEIMVGRWFQSDMSDEDLLNYLNNTDEGQKILSGLAFRIPTQAQNSIDAFRIKKFLPKEFGDSVVVPAAIVKKVGSDFDIDKLFIYFKNTFYQDGKLKLVPYFGMGKEAKAMFAKMFDEGKLLNKKQKDALDRLLLDFKAGEIKIQDDEQLINLLSQIGVVSEEDVLEEFTTMLDELGIKETIVNRMYKQSLENEFIQSSENLVTHPSNFERLITPNDATQLKDISKTIVDKTVGKSFDYTDVSNLLDRRFMSRLRQAFVAGKQAIGIAAVQQTNHSLNQRAAIYIDEDRLENVSFEDRKFLGDAKVKFQKYNKVTIDGKEYASLSGVNNADGQRISNILGQFIDGYVDISKGPWIMEMGATPNVASTFMFLVKIGVPVDTVAYFMNQPIIREYLQSVENAGYKFLFIDDFIDKSMSEMLDVDIEEVQEYLDKNKDGMPKSIPDRDSLLDSLGQTTFTKEEKLQQVFMLQEFLKYSKMANQLFQVTQGTNWDTSNFNDPFLVFKKNLQLAKSQNSIISSSNDILNNSFIGNLANKINDSRDGLANFLVSDRGNVRNVLERVLMPYSELPNKAFVKVARKAVNDLFDWAIQTDQGLNLQLQESLLSNKGTASEIVSFIDDIKKNSKHALYNNHIIDILEVRSSTRAGNTPTNITIKNKDNKAYDQNNIIYSFRELKDYLKGRNDLYNKIVTLSILQSGLGNSPISFTSLIPYEDVSRIYNKTLSKIETLSNLDDFYNLGVFQRNNWNDNDIVPSNSLHMLFGERGPFYPSLNFNKYKNAKRAMDNGEIPQLVSGGTGAEYEVFSWTDLDISATERANMRKAGDYSYIKKGLFKKVYDTDSEPLTTQSKNGREYFVYKAVNAWGDSFRAQEFYTEAKKSIIDNGMMKVSNEVIDEMIVPLMTSTAAARTYNKVETGPLTITVKGDRITVNNRTFAASMITYENLVERFGYTEEQAGEIINVKCKG